VSPVFAHGDLRLYLLTLLDERPRHGYELIKALEDRFYGLYTPSAGTIYPRLAALEDAGLVTHEMVAGRKVYRLTDAGREEVAARGDELDDLEDRVRASARHIAKEIRSDVKATVRELRDELREATRQVRREERRTRDEGWADLHRTVRSLRHELRAFADDVVDAARETQLDRTVLRAVRVVLDEARAAVVDVLEGKPAKADDPEH
jgi:DNA-binding PadR family transcriptional regulator